jgi:hypothetical protein
MNFVPDEALPLKLPGYLFLYRLLCIGALALAIRTVEDSTNLRRASFPKKIHYL